MPSDSLEFDLKLALITCSVISLISSCIILFIHAKFVQLRSRSAKLVVWLSVADALMALSIIVFLNIESPSRTEIVVFSFLLNFFLLAAAFWSAIISMTMSFVIIQRGWLLERLSSTAAAGGPQVIGQFRMLRHHCFVWGGALLLTLIPTCLGSFADYTEAWHWFQHNNTSKIVALLCYYLPLLLVFLYNGFILIWLRIVRAKFIHDRINIYDSRNLAGQLHDLAISLKNYPLITMVSSLAVFAVEGIRLSSQDRDDDSGAAERSTYWLFVLLAVLQVSQGSMNLVVYLLRLYRTGKLPLLIGRLASSASADSSAGRLSETTTGSLNSVFINTDSIARSSTITPEKQLRPTYDVEHGRRSGHRPAALDSRPPPNPMLVLEKPELGHSPASSRSQSAESSEPDYDNSFKFALGTPCTPATPAHAGAHMNPLLHAMTHSTPQTSGPTSYVFETPSGISGQRFSK